MKKEIILKKTNKKFENEVVFNSVNLLNVENTRLFYRALQKGNYSSIGYCKLKNYLTIEDRLNIPEVFPQFEY